MMKRRKAVKILATSVGALLVLPAWAKGWTPAILNGGFPILNAAQEDLLQALVETIIPEGTTPGAVSLGVPAFVQKMLADCQEKKVQDNFAKGLEAVEDISKETYGQPFAVLTAAQKIELLKGLSASTDTSLKDFYTLLKSLTIQGYTTSEYVMVNHWEYEMAPGHYHGCVPVIGD